jgi:glucosamine-6-phosphate deaminase
VLGLPTGNTPIGVYRELVRLHGERRISFATATTFNLDEYLGLGRDHPHSFRRWMTNRFFAHVDLPPERAHLPELAPSDPHAEAARYESAIRAAGGLDLMLLGIGRNGHVGFNEPGSTRDSRTRVVDLHAETREDAAITFGGLEHVPKRAITMGVATILDARAVRVLAFGAGKAGILRRTLHDPIGPAVPATYLREHADVRIYADRDAARELDA